VGASWLNGRSVSSLFFYRAQFPLALRAWVPERLAALRALARVPALVLALAGSRAARPEVRQHTVLLSVLTLADFAPSSLQVPLVLAVPLVPVPLPVPAERPEERWEDANLALQLTLISLSLRLQPGAVAGADILANTKPADPAFLASLKRGTVVSLQSGLSLTGRRLLLLPCLQATTRTCSTRRRSGVSARWSTCGRTRDATNSTSTSSVSAPPSRNLTALTLLALALAAWLHVADWSTKWDEWVPRDSVRIQP
jgi:hypothetical protein